MNNKSLTDDLLVEIVQIYENSICSSIIEPKEQTIARLVFADLMAILIKIKTNYKCCEDKECPRNVIKELKLFLEVKKNVLQKYLHQKDIEILQTIIEENK